MSEEKERPEMSKKKMDIEETLIVGGLFLTEEKQFKLSFLMSSVFWISLQIFVLSLSDLLHISFSRLQACLFAGEHHIL